VLREKKTCNRWGRLRANQKGEKQTEKNSAAATFEVYCRRTAKKSAISG